MTAAVVLPYWKMPHWSRLREFLEWNREALSPTKVVVVIDKVADIPEMPFPDNVVLMRHPDDRNVFSLARTCNYGIRWAIDNGFNPVIKTDADVMFALDAIMELMNVRMGFCISSIYNMVDSVAERHVWTKNRVEAPLAQGTISMVADNWKDIFGYNENLEGYGCDDGDLIRRAHEVFIREVRGFPVYHIAHQQGAVQQEAHTIGDKKNGVRTDHWNRKTGINPNRMAANAARSRSEKWRNPEWGRHGG